MLFVYLLVCLESIRCHYLEPTLSLMLDSHAFADVLKSYFVRCVSKGFFRYVVAMFVSMRCECVLCDVIPKAFTDMLFICFAACIVSVFCVLCFKRLFQISLQVTVKGF